MIDFFSNIIGKSIDNINGEDLIQYFGAPRQESTVIEYKSYNRQDASKREEKIAKIIRSVAAMLNSSGGIIIWGAPAPKKIEETGEHVVMGELSPVLFEIGSDQFSNIIYSNISPSPKGVRFRPVKVADDGFIYLIEVHPSQYPPHQYDGRYYARFDGVTKPAPHYLVEALMKKVKYPEVQASVKFGQPVNGKDYTLIPGMVSVYNLDHYQPVINLQGIINFSERGFSLAEAEYHTPFEDGLQDSISLSSSSLSNNSPYFSRFAVVARNNPNERTKVHREMNIKVWADNLPAHFSCYKLEYWFSKDTGRNLIEHSVTFENKTIFELLADQESSEQAYMNNLELEQFEQFEQDFEQIGIIQRLMGNRRF